MRMHRVIMLVCLVTLTACRARIGESCDRKDSCALGLYCDLEREVCADRGALLKKGAAETYVYPIPPKTPPSAPLPTPVPVGDPTSGDTEKTAR